jgi:predicted DNA-binding transcriptional regulator AlpA
MTIHRYSNNNPRFPKKHRIGTKAVGFKLDELKKFIEEGAGK